MKITKDMLLIEAFQMGDTEKWQKYCKVLVCIVLDALFLMEKQLNKRP